MSRFITILVALCTFSSMVLADHATLKTLSRRLTIESSELDRNVRVVIGYSPTYRQQYAYEHIQFLQRSSTRFEQAVLYGFGEDHGASIRQAFRALDRDAYYARQTLEDLFSYNNEDHTPNGIRSLMARIESTISQIRYNLP